VSHSNGLDRLEDPSVVCPVCAGKAVSLGSCKGILDKRDYEMLRCKSCRFAFISNYRHDYANVYDRDYYHGTGADLKVNYAYEIENFRDTIRNYEWKGIFEIYSKLTGGRGKWLDFGCGGGGLVRYAKERGVDAVGFEEGWIAEKGRQKGVSILDASELEGQEGCYDFISAIEVMEHLPDPVQVLKQIRKLLKPGGILFITTGNAEPWRDDLLAWQYTHCPDVHISFYEPDVMKNCMERASFRPEAFDFFGGFTDIIKFKVLKSFKIRNRSLLFDVLPWSVVSRIVDSRHRVTAQPYGVAE
jgi:SAM-dependent methyltransferase